MQCEYRYRNDPDFKALVDLNYSFIAQHRYSTTELREAAVFAATLYALRNPVASFPAPDLMPLVAPSRLSDGREPEPKRP